MQYSLSPSLGLSASRTGSGNRSHVVVHAKSKKQRDYGSGRQRLGIEESAPSGSSSSSSTSSDITPGGSAPSATLGEYLRFGKMIGERVQDVQRQLDLNGAAVRVDEASQQYLDEWQNEQLNAYSMFEALVDEGVRGRAGQENSVLMKNKNRLAATPQSLAKFVEKTYGNAPRAPSAAERKLARNRMRMGPGSSAPDASEEVNAFELVAAGPVDSKKATPSLAGKPNRPAGTAEQEAEWAAEISDEDWDEGISTDEDEAPQEDLPAPTYQDFEAALAAASGGPSPPSRKAKGKQQEGSITLRLGDIPRKPKALPKVDLASKPLPRPGAVERAAPPPPATLSGPPKSLRPVARPPPPPPAAPKLQAPPPLQASPMRPPTAEVQEEPTPPAPVPTPAAAPAPVAAAPVPAPVSPPTPPTPVVQQQAQPPPIPESVTLPKPPVAAAPPAAPRVPSSPISKKPIRSAPTPQTARPSFDPETRDRERAARHIRSLEIASALQESNGQTEVKVWQVNAAGLLVTSADGLTGFIPLTEMSHKHAAAVLTEERRLSALPEAVEGPALRRAAMSILKDLTFLVEVIALDKEAGRVILSERAAVRSMATRPSEAPSSAALSLAAAAVGQLVPARIRSVRPFGVFVDFPLKNEDGTDEMAFGLVHSSELSWDAYPTSSQNGGAPSGAAPNSKTSQQIGVPGALFIPGQQVTARLTHVDFAKGRIFLSIKRATPNPLLETLDSLLANAGGTPAVANDGASASAVPGPRQTMDASVDVRPLLGDLEVAQKFAEAVVETEGVVSATLGVRLESRASSPDVEVYMAKESAVSEGEDDGKAPKVYKLVLRKGRDVQEVEVACMLDRASLRELAAATVAKIGADARS